MKLLVAYFKDDQKKYAKAPKLEIDASANDYGQAEPVLTNAVRINGMPLANVHAYSFRLEAYVDVTQRLSASVGIHGCGNESA